MAEEDKEIPKETEKQKKKFSQFYDQNYKKFLLIPAILLVLSLVFLAYFYSQHQDIIKKDVSLTGGTSITVYGETDISALKESLSTLLSDFSIRGISDLRSGRQIGFVIQTTADANQTKITLEQYLNYKLTEENSSIEFSGSSLSSSFYKQLRLAIILAFLLMALVVFVIFRTFIPSLAVVLSAFADITLTLALVDFLGWRISSAGIIAFLMLIGYSVDTDIMLTSRILKRREGSINSRIYSAFKTGITMTLTSIVAVVIALIITSGFSEVLRQIFFVLTIGLSFDLLNTWVTNAGILKWYAEKKERGEEDV